MISHLSRVDPCLTLLYNSVVFTLIYNYILLTIDDASIIIRSSVSDCMCVITGVNNLCIVLCTRPRPEGPRPRIVVKFGELIK